MESLKERFCFRCGANLKIEEFLKYNEGREEEYLTQLWNSEYVEILCCSCYVFKTKFQPDIT
jgi:hypothetical protein